MLLFLGLIFTNLCISYLGDRTNPDTLAPVLFFSFCLISLIVDYQKYYNKKLYQSIGVLFLALIWLVYIMSPNVEDIKFLLLLILMSLLLGYLIIYQPREWEKQKKELEQQDEVME